MASSYSLYDMTGFPVVQVGTEYRIPYQLPLFQDIDRAPETSLHLKRIINTRDSWEVFRVHYEYIDKRIGRAKGITFSAFVAMVDFPAYYSRQRRLFLVKASKPMARGAMRQLIKGSAGVKGACREISLDSIKHLIDSYKGVYFSVDDSTDVSTVALFGPSVNQDIRFTRASIEGAMNYARFDYEFDNEYFHVGISSDSNVVLYDNNLDEVLELDLVLDIKQKLLEQARTKDSGAIGSNRPNQDASRSLGLDFDSLDAPATT